VYPDAAEKLKWGVHYLTPYLSFSAASGYTVGNVVQ